MPENCDILCGPSCNWIFSQIRVWPLIAGGTIVEWVLHPNFADPGSYTFQLQFGRTGSAYADDWVNVGAEVVDDYYAIDDRQRVYGKTQWTHYRVLLTTSEATYASAPQHAMGNLSRKDWLLVKELTRLETVRLKKAAGQLGYLLKRKLFGTACPDCLDEQTQEIRNAQCATCYGTGLVGGYYDPVPCFYVELSPKSLRNELDSGESRGTVDDLPRVKGRMINNPQVFSYDVWVDKDTDSRWIIHQIQNAVEVRGVPVVLQAEMRLAPYSHPIYTIEIDGQTPDLS